MKVHGLKLLLFFCCFMSACVLMYLLRLKQPSGTEIHHNLETSTCDPLKYKMDNPIFIVTICMGRSIRIQRVNRISHL